MAMFVIGAAPALAEPQPVLSGYTGAFYGLENQSWRDYLPLMRDNGFTAIDLKLHPGNSKLSDPGYAAWVTEVSRAVQEAGLEFHVWLYDGNRGQRPDEAPLSLAFVGPDGIQNPARYCLYQLDSWRTAFARLFELAELSQTLPIKSVKMDVEMLLNHVPCVCDDCFGSFAASQQAPGLQLEPAKRWAWVKEHGGEAGYMAHLEERMNQVAREFARQAHGINPRLSLGLMPYEDNHLRRPWARHLATAEAPGYIESWPMYNGLGYTEEITAEAEAVKSLNPNNLYIPWFRINMYKPQEMAEQAFIAAANGDGYNMWTIGMIHPSVATKKPNRGYELPVGYEDPMAFWQALGNANARVREWAKNPVPVAISPLKPLVIAVDLTKVKVPELKPVSAAPSATAAAPPPPPTGLRGNNKLYIHVADPAEPVRFTIRHLAGKARPTNLGFALLAANAAPVLEEQVAPGETKEMNVQVKQAGTYGLFIQTSEGGGPWYDVKVLSHPYAVDATQVYFFRNLPPQHFQVPAGTASFRIKVSTGASEEVRVIVCSPEKVVRDEVVTGARRGGEVLEVPVPGGAGGIWSVWVGKPETMQADHYSENYHLELLDVPPYLSDRPHAVLEPAF